MVHELFEEIDRFKFWANHAFEVLKIEQHNGWEMDYSNWPSIWTAFEDFLTVKPSGEWSREELTSILFIIGRDNDCESIIEMVASHPKAHEYIAEEGLNYNDDRTQWQIAASLSQLKSNPHLAIQLSIKYFQKENEYVSRMALQSLGKLQSDLTEYFCEQSWERWNDEHNHIMVLTVLYEYRSPLILKYLDKAKADGRTYLLKNVQTIEEKIRRGS